MLSVGPLEALVLLLPLGLGLALLYGLLRWFAWTPRGASPVWSARVHGLVVALVALLVSWSAGRMPDGVIDAGRDQAAPDGPGVVVLDPAVTRVTGMDQLPAPDPASLFTALALGALTPAVLFLVVWWVGQHTWPPSTGPVRQGRLTALEPCDVLPRALTLACTLAALVAAAGQAWPLLHHARVAAAGSPAWAGDMTWGQPWALTALGLILAFLPGLSVDPRTGRSPGEEPDA